MKRSLRHKLLFAFLLPYIICSYSSLYGGPPIVDSLESQLLLATTDTQKVILYNHLAWEYKDSDLERADAYVQKAIQLADQTAYRKGLAIAYKNKGVIALYQSNMEEARQYLHDAILQFEILHNKAEKANTLNNLGMYWQMVGNNREALAHFEASAAIREMLGNEKWIGNSCNNLGVMYFFMGNYEKSLQNHLRALKIWKRIGDQKEITSSFLNLGSVYRVMEDYGQALAYFHDGLRSAEVLDNFRGMADAYANIGDIWLIRKDYTQALKYYQHALQLREKLTDKTGIREALSSIGEVYAAQGNYHEAVNYYLRSLHICQAIGDKTGAVTQYNLLGDALIKQGRADEALSYLFDGIKVAEELILLPELSKAFKLTSKAYVVKKEYPLAFQYQQQHMDIKDRIFTEESTQKMMELKIKYESEAQQKEIDLLKKENTIFELQRDRWIFISIMLVLIGIAIFLLYRYLIQTRVSHTLQDQKREIAIRNRALEISNRDLEQFAYVVSHDLKQPLRTISSFTGLLARRYRPLLDRDGEEFINFILDGVERMNTLLKDLLLYSQIGRKESGNLIDLRHLLNQVLKDLKHVIEEKKASITIESLPLIEGNQTAMKQLFQNLVSNALKFHRDVPPRIFISYEEYSDQYVFCVKDNGIGIEAQHKNKIFAVFQRLHAEDVYPGTGIGLSICQKVVKQHGGDLWVDSTPGKGSTFYFSLPKERHTSMDT